MSARKPTVFLVDDDPGVLRALARQLRSAGYRVETFDNPAAFLRRYDPERPGCLLLDLAMPGLDGLTVQRRLGEAGHAPPIVFLTGRGELPACVRAMKAGAVDFLAKPVVDSVLFAAIEEAIGRDAQARRARHGLASIQHRIASLTPRELEVLRRVVAGKPNKQIAAELGIVESTIKIHRARVMAKMRVRSLPELTLLAERSGLALNPISKPEDA